MKPAELAGSEHSPRVPLDAMADADPKRLLDPALPTMRIPRAQATRLLVSPNTTENRLFTSTAAQAQAHSRIAGWSNAYYRLRQGVVGHAYKLALSDPTTNSIVRHVLENGQELIFNNGESHGANVFKARPAWVAFTANDDLRREVIATINAEANLQSQAIKQAIDKRPDVLPYWHTMIIGGGIHASEVASSMAAQHPNQSIVTVEQMNTLAANFGLSGELFDGNTENDAERAGAITPGHGNMNFLASPVGVPDIDPRKWNKGKSFADAATIGLYTSGSDFLMEDKPATVRDRQRAHIPGSEAWPGQLEVTLASGRKVYTDQLVFTTGLGEPLYPFTDPGTLALISAEEKRIDFATPDTLPDVVSFDTAMRYAQLSGTPLEPYRHRADGTPPVTAIIGNGDGSRVFLQLMMRQAPQGAYTGRTPEQTESAQRGQVGPMSWFVGPSGPANATEFRQQTWDRYLPLAASLEDGHIAPVQAYLQKIERLTSGPDSGRLQLTYATPAGDKSQVVDRVVLSTGFRSKTGEVVAGAVAGLDTKVPLEKNAEATEKIYSAVAGFDTPKPIGREVKGSPIYLAGPAAGTDLVVAATDLNGVSQNPISIFALGHRSAALGEQTLAVKAGTPVRKFVWQTPDTLRLRAGFGEGAAIVPHPETLPVVDPWSAFRLRQGLAAVLAQFRFPTAVKLEISLQPGTHALVVRAPGLNAAAATALGNAIAVQPGLVPLAAVLLRPGRGRHIAVTADVDAAGAVKIPSVLTQM